MSRHDPSGSRGGCRGLAAVLCGLALWCSHASAGIYLQLEGIAGEVQDPGHEGWLEVLSFDWQATQPATPAQPGGLLDIRELTLHRYVDKASPALMQSLFVGGTIDHGRFHFVEEVNGKPATVLTFDLTNILVTRYATEAASEATGVLETIDLLFDEFVETMFRFGDDGAPAGESLVFWTVSSGIGGASDLPDTEPTVGSLADVTIAEDTSAELAFTIGDGQTPSGALIVTRGSSNPLLVPVSNIVLGGSGSNRTATITPAANQSGTAVISIEVSDGKGKVESHFTLTVTPVNDPPALSEVATQITNTGVPVAVSVTISDIDSDPAAASLEGVSSNPTLLPNPGIVVSGSTGTRTVTLNPVPGLSGQAVVTLTAIDGAGAPSAPSAFLLIVNPVGGGGPTDIMIDETAVAENSPGGTSIGRFKVLDPDEGDTHVLALVDDVGGRFVIGGAAGNYLLVAPGAELDHETAATHTVIVKATDPAQQWYIEAFTITVTNVNEAPKIVLAELPPAETGSQRVISGIAVHDVDAGADPIEMTLEVDHGALTVSDPSGRLAGGVTNNGSAHVGINAPLGDINAVIAAGGLVYQSSAGFAGSETLTVAVDDLGASGSGGPQTAVASGAFEVIATGFEAFRRQYFNPLELLDLAVSGEAADPDHDRLTNLGEYGLHGNPRDGTDAGRLIEWLWLADATNQRRPALRFFRPAGDSRLSVVVEVATDLVNWRSGGGFTSEVEVLGGLPGIPAGHERVTARSERSTGDEPRQLLRVRISLSP